jgi:hypothetical protein
MRWKAVIKEDAQTGRSGTVPIDQPDDLVTKNEQKIIARATAPLRGKGFRTLAEQDSYVRKILST